MLHQDVRRLYIQVQETSLVDVLQSATNVDEGSEAVCKAKPACLGLVDFHFQSAALKNLHGHEVRRQDAIGLQYIWMGRRLQNFKFPDRTLMTSENLHGHGAPAAMAPAQVDRVAATDIGDHAKNGQFTANDLSDTVAP